MNVKIFIFGFYWLKVYGFGVDIDILCVGLRYVIRGNGFFGELYRMFSELFEVIEFYFVFDVYVFLMGFKFNGIFIDFLYV